MSWFDEQIKSRIRYDEDSFEEAFVNLSSVVLGKSVILAALNDDRKKTKTAIEEILKYYGAKVIELPEQLEDMNDQLEYLMRPSGIMRRVVNLTGTWYKDGSGPLLGRTTDGSVVALIPSGMSGYAYFDYEQKKSIKVTKANAGCFESEAMCFYKPLPLRSLTAVDLIKYMFDALKPSDYVLTVIAVLAVTLLGMFTPYINNLMFAKVIPSGQMSLLLPISCLLIGAAVSSTLIGITKTLVVTRLDTKMNVTVQSAMMARLLQLPTSFFKDYASGDLSSRLSTVNSLCTRIVNAIFGGGLTGLFSLVYISQMAGYAPALVTPALLTLLATVAVTVVTAIFELKENRIKLKTATKVSGIVFSLFTGVQKIKLGGAERRAFTKWAEAYKEEADAAYAMPLFLKLAPAILMVIPIVGTIFIYWFSAGSGVTIADYMAFSVAYGMVSSAFSAFAAMTSSIAGIKPALEMAEPIMKAVPEISEEKTVVTKLTGGIELNNVSFRYVKDGPLIIDDLDLKIRPGQYVAIVGPTGCGKSTLMRLLLGFETPEMGAVYYDGKDISKLDLKSLRQHIGVVMQNGKLFSGDLYSNITISAPQLTLDEAWEAAEMAGVAEDIRNMPMGMNTIVSEGGGGISGGQRQRIMIARAIAPKPKIVFFDEATSALDNITQKQVSQSMDNLKSTRIVIAHRLSTIRQCDRIVVLNKGRIIEDGKYDDLIALNGFFAELVSRQRIENPGYVAKTTLY